MGDYYTGPFHCVIYGGLLYRVLPLCHLWDSTIPGHSVVSWDIIPGPSAVSSMGQYYTGSFRCAMGQYYTGSFRCVIYGTVLYRVLPLCHGTILYRVLLLCHGTVLYRVLPLCHGTVLYRVLTLCHGTVLYRVLPLCRLWDSILPGPSVVTSMGQYYTGSFRCVIYGTVLHRVLPRHIASDWPGLSEAPLLVTRAFLPKACASLTHFHPLPSLCETPRLL